MACNALNMTAKKLAGALLLCGFLLVSAFGTTAQATPVSKEMANNYYKNCLAKRDARMSDQTQRAFCACTSAEFMKNMSVEDIKEMYGDTSRSRTMLNRMLMTVYVPCMDGPVADMVDMQCRNDKKAALLQLQGRRSDLCNCMGQRTGEWFKSSGRDIMAKVLADNPNTYDPLTPVLESKTFQNQAFQFLMQCTHAQ